MAFLCPVRIRRNKKKKAVEDDMGSSASGMPSMGRITGSASIETLVRVGIEKENGLGPESKMVVLHDFTPCVDDELEVKRGQIVHVLYQENDWVYVISEENNQEGFIPHSYCAQFGSQLATLALNVKKKLPRDQISSTGSFQATAALPGGGVSAAAAAASPSYPAALAGSTLSMAAASTSRPPQPSYTNAKPDVVMAAAVAPSLHFATVPSGSGGGAGRGPEPSDSTDSSSLLKPTRNGVHDQSRTNSMMSETSSQPDIHPFFKDPSGRYVVLYSYSAQDENDLSVERGQCVTVLNTDDPDWFWVSKYDGQEGFVPSGFIYPLDAIQRQQGYTPARTTATLHPSGRPTHSSSHAPWSGGSTGSSGPPSFTHASSALALQATTTATSLAAAPVAYSADLKSAVGLPQNGLPSADLCYSGTELVVLYDYKAQAPDDLTVRRGEWVYADLNNQTIDGWLWTYAPKTRKYGFIPKAYAKPPAMTSL